MIRLRIKNTLGKPSARYWMNDTASIIVRNKHKMVLEQTLNVMPVQDHKVTGNETPWEDN